MIRLGRISYVNMAPVFYRLEAEVEEVTGVPTELNRRLSPARSTSRRSRRSSGRGTPTGCGILPRLCVGSEGAVDSIQLVSQPPLEQVRTRRGHARERDLGRADEGAAPRGRARAARRGGGREAADRRRRAEERVRGPDAALRPRAAVARAHRAADGVRGLGRAGPVAPGHGGARGRARRLGARARAEPEQLAYEASERYGYPAGFLARYFEKLRYRFGPRERAGLFTFLEMARDVGELDGGAGAALRPRGGGRREPHGARRVADRALPERAAARRCSRRTCSARGSPSTTSALTDNLDGAVKPKSYFIFSFDQKPLAELGEAATRRPPEEIALTGGPYGLRRTIVSVRVNPTSPYRVDARRRAR